MVYEGEITVKTLRIVLDIASVILSVATIALIIANWKSCSNCIDAEESS